MDTDTLDRIDTKLDKLRETFVTRIEHMEKRLDGMERLHKQYRTAVKEAMRPVPFKLWFDDYMRWYPLRIMRNH